LDALPDWLSVPSACAILAIVIQTQAPVTAIRALPKGNYMLVVEAPEIARTSLPGQFVMVAVAGQSVVPNPLLKRALAVYTVPDRKTGASKITLLLRVVGEGTQRLAEVRSGALLDLVGPLGNGFDLGRARARVSLLVVGGTGIASVYLLAEQLLREGEEVRLIYGGRSAEDLVGLQEFQALDLPIIVTTEDGSLGIRGLVTEGLRLELQEVPGQLANIYTCGPTPMMQAVSELAVKGSIPCQLSVEVKMACGFGVCLGCTVKTKGSYRLACTHGPVFDAADFEWERTYLETGAAR
jgi:dihydroorotate dehydrogenase electron transfer subunit